MTRLTELFTKYKEIIMYLIMGVATTVVSWTSYSIFTFVFASFEKDVKVLIANILSWILAILFAYFTNKIWVFQSYSWKLSFIAAEFGKFVSARALTGLIEILGVPFLVIKMGLDATIFGVDGMGSKVLISVVVIILNYVLSKLIIFKNKGL